MIQSNPVSKSIINSFLLIGLCLLLISSCKSDDEEVNQVPAATSADIVFNISNTVDGATLISDTLAYTNASGNVYSVSVLKYYLSNFVFIADDGSEFYAPNYELIIESDASYKTFVIDNVPNGNYTSMRFFMGVDSTRNFSGALTGDLDPVHGMLWDWNTGYLYFMHEGEFIDSTGAILPITFHYGTLKSLVTEEIPISIKVSGKQRTIELSFNLNKVYASPNQMNFNGDNFHQSTGPGENGWVQLIKQNFQGAFSVTAID
ncbi:MAG: hypothetical protein JNL49_13565 [Bacteroidia bacterium]|nr:hypothetical protein [Bacteroidia bacterium]